MTEPTWCASPAELDDRELKLLVEAAVDVLAEAARDVVPADDLSAMPESVLAGELGDALAEIGLADGVERARSLVGDPALARKLGVALVARICAEPALRETVDEAYRARRGMMVVEPVTLMAAALLLLVVKLRRVKVGKDGVEVNFDPVKADMVKEVGDLVRP